MAPSTSSQWFSASNPAFNLHGLICPGRLQDRLRELKHGPGTFRGRDVRRGYLELLGKWMDGLRRTCGESDVEYVLVRTDQPLDEVLIPFLARRERSAA